MFFTISLVCMGKNKQIDVITDDCALPKKHLISASIWYAGYGQSIVVP
jgi:hypothetical protein